MIRNSRRKKIEDSPAAMSARQKMAVNVIGVQLD